MNAHFLSFPSLLDTIQMADQDGQEALLPAWWVGTVDRLPAGLAYCSCKPATGTFGSGSARLGLSQKGGLPFRCCQF
jgi:hypothetical protein